MKNKSSTLLHKLIFAVRRVFAYPAFSLYPIIRKMENHKDAFSQHVPRNDCYYCNGSGFMPSGFDFEEFMFSRNLGTTSHISSESCPVCKGRGHIEAQNNDLA